MKRLITQISQIKQNQTTLKQKNIKLKMKLKEYQEEIEQLQNCGEENDNKQIEIIIFKVKREKIQCEEINSGFQIYNQDYNNTLDTNDQIKKISYY